MKYKKPHPSANLEEPEPGMRFSEQPIRDLSRQMGRVSRQIGLSRARGENTDALLRRMRELSRERKQLQEAREELPVAPAREPSGATDANLDNSGDMGSATFSTDISAASLGTLAIACNTVSQEEWDAYVSAHPRASQYHQYCWKTIVEESFGHSTFYLSARESHGRLVGILPLVRIASRLFGDYVVSVPFVNYGGALGDSPEVELVLMKEAGVLAGQLGCNHVEFRDSTFKGSLPLRSDKVSMRLALPATADQLWEKFSSKLRAQVRRADRERPVAVIGGSELLPEFYAVFAHNMRDLGTPVYAAKYFWNILERVPSARIIVIRLRNRAVSAGFLLGYRHMLEIPWASTLRSVSPLGINMFLYWTVLQYAIRSGYTMFDFGRSTVDSGTYRFKKQWGAAPVALYWHYWLPEGSDVPQLNPGNPKYRLAIAVWKKLPLWLANRLGPLIVKNLP